MPFNPIRVLNPALRSAATAPRFLASRSFHTSLPRMTIHNIETLDGFKETIAKNPIVVLDAFATWCGPCKAIAPLVAKWSESPEFKDTVYFAKFDVDHLPDLSQELGIRAMPTFIIFKDGEKVDEFVGANPGPLQSLVTKYATAAA
ncbi:cytoplasmic thioredoxin isoenzyme 2 [Phialemonium atrogriseum]|uniref:Cytoplasmic thioredoxin isoenzyme 2 n=1 Tax=Phialemonium atrogriseum TaxID=1093897 RepID=A0AAJ0FHS0_9PEZI|nr:cytoplasmic thioredoxin isoenzyme 2 [Phialemonium atrogriseum]KAK1768027.1 cytoplasmic thioredoxin isoenzyme 2 [Phialemonium atrogriseum]